MAPPTNAFRAVSRVAWHRSTPNYRRPFVAITRGRLVEEETLPHYDPEQFYPVNIGDVLNGKYEVTGKLGFGAYSTSWLCRDIQRHKFAVLKASTSLREFPVATHREFKVYEHLASIESDHPGQSLIRELWDTFEVTSTAGQHQCLMLQPMHMTLLEMMERNPRPFDMPLLKMTLQRVLLALDFLHTEADVIHLDLKTDNLMLSLEEDAMLSDFMDKEIRQPSPRKKVDESRTIHQSSKFRQPSAGEGFGLPILCDFGEARIGQIQETGPFVQPHIYRAPEIIFEMAWGSAVDIWNLGALLIASQIWDLFEGYHLFGDIFSSNGKHDPFKHLALMVALLGPPPGDFVRRSETTEQCFDRDGAWIACNEAAVPSTTLEDLEIRLSGSEKEKFLGFVRSMLKWLPEERKTAAQLLDDPWLLF
ncbi:hypothetical protein M409DRAFT_58907 [Zasmidium cellare ATCC 36951]|uniref:Protein kinase domain-containing protein n=1 Tax=Zasmidium cellare ATCC 36951 TaxID=1080233 RepID=A0A6A6C6K9_ZASCE|nr:uncharacterized protein M409DRAFT_58907 [Zasmidium cellare ATCC 36951]KAF2161840.1 hypothetical protein M409DRAFT_58907 [Zasmidium cellare ATCC 36951]